MSQKTDASSGTTISVHLWFNGSNPLLSIGSILVGTLSGFWVNGILEIKPVQANSLSQSIKCLNQTIKAPASQVHAEADNCSPVHKRNFANGEQGRTSPHTLTLAQSQAQSHAEEQSLLLQNSAPVNRGIEETGRIPPHTLTLAQYSLPSSGSVMPQGKVPLFPTKPRGWSLSTEQYSLPSSPATPKIPLFPTKAGGWSLSGQKSQAEPKNETGTTPQALSPSAPRPLILAQSHAGDPEKSTLQNTRPSATQVLGTPEIRLQGVVLNQGSTSARARASVIYPISPYVLFGATVDLTTGNDFSDSLQPGLDLNELYVAASPKNLPGVRFVAGLMDLTSYFDRNSFAKDGATHFFNRVFQTNPALSATGIASRPGFLVNWAVTDNLEVKATTFSSSRNIGDLALDAFAGEVGLRAGNAIIRGTFATDRDAGYQNGFREIFQIPRGNGRYGFRRSDRQQAYGINGEYFIPKLKLGLFGRYGRYDNLAINQGGDTYSFGLNFLDLFAPSDRLGLAYGRDLSNEELRRQSGAKVPDVLEAFYDFRLLPYLRVGLTFQERNQFSDTIVGFRIKTEFDVSPIRRLP